MSEDRNNSQGLVGQAHAVEHGSPPPPAPTLSGSLGIGAATGVAAAAEGVERNDSPPRSPRTLLLRRGENGFGFTLRHFIVYPPESCCMLPGHEPMDTIFVKQVRGNSPAAEAGLRTGDRVVSVDGKPTRGEQYAKVVQRIQQAGPWLRLLVVSKEDDILQRYFGEAAHNPETNQRPRLRSPERSSQKQRRSISMIPGLSSRARQSWVCSGQTSTPGGSSKDCEPDCSIGDSVSTRGADPRSSDVAKEIVGHPRGNSSSSGSGSGSGSSTETQLAKSGAYHCKPYRETAGRSESLDEKVRLRRQRATKEPPSSSNVHSSCDLSMQFESVDSKYDKHDRCDRSRSESVYSRSNSEQIYDNIPDPIYERVRSRDPGRGSIEDPYHLHQQQQQYYQSRQQHSNLQEFPLSRAEPQVPIYRSAARRINWRRASEGSNSSSTMNNFDTASYVSSDAVGSCEPGSRFSIDSRRDSSPMRVCNDGASYDSTPVLVGGSGVNGTRSESLPAYRTNNGVEGVAAGAASTGVDDSVIMTRLRKSFEQKEEFLRRPSHPIGWFLPEDRPESPVGSNGSAAAIPREFYARPQKLQKQIWPPIDSKLEHQSTAGRVSQDSGNGFASSSVSSQPVQRVRSSGVGGVGGGAGAEYARERVDRVPESSSALRASEQTHRSNDHLAVLSALSAYDSPESNQAQQLQQLQRTVGKTSNFVGTLSRIHENVATVGALLSSERRSTESKNGSSSLPSSPGPEKKANEKFPALPPGLQIVSKRTRQFESGQLLSEDDEPTGDRTSLYRSELSRLSNKRSVPNVAVRKREFESKAEAQEPRRIAALPARESKSLDTGNGLKGNRVIPVGSSRIHCEPPDTSERLEEINNRHPTRVEDGSAARSRIRSNSAESWDSSGTSNSLNADRHRWAQRQDNIQRKADGKQYEAYDVVDIDEDEDVRDDDGVYVDMTSSNAGGSGRAIEKAPRAQQQDDYEEIIGGDHGSHPPNNDAHGNGVVFRRQRNTEIADEDRATRRVSYLKATWGDRLHVDSEFELSDSEASSHGSRSLHKRWRLPLLPNDIASLRRIFEEVTHSASLNRNVNRASTAACPGLDSAAGIAKHAEQVEREGLLHVKFTVLDGKRSSDRSWKQVWAVLRGPILLFYKDRQNQSPSVASDGESVAQNVDVRCSLVDIPGNYTKRKHVLRLTNPNAEVLLQTEDAASMAVWLRALHEHAAAEKPSEIANNSTLKQQAVPQTPGPASVSSTAGQTVSHANAITVSSGTGAGGQRLSPLPGHKGIKKLTSFRNRSPTGQSPINKTRKSSQTIESSVSPKTKTWKGRVAKQLRRMHGQAGPPSSPVAQLPPEGATFKVPLEVCPPSSFSEYVPLIVEMCTSIVEARGLEVIGIYRVPGNTAAISHLTETVNKGFENINLQDPRWSDVNVISSLLKSFFRQLPDSLLTADLYPMFIDADKVEDPQRRMTTIRKLLRDLPEHHFETLKYLMFHLKRIVEHSEINKMEAKNLAIVFGPTLVRASGSRDNMVTMVTDMSHQCRIVESLLNNVDWFFSDDDLDDLSRLSVNLSLPADTSELETATTANNHNLLLNNIQKVEGVREMASAKDIVSSIISAANRKIQRRRKGQDETDNENNESDKPRGKQDGESSTNRRSMALHERQCSVSEIVLMHENKNRPGERSATIEGATIGDAAISDNDQATSCSGGKSCEGSDVHSGQPVKYSTSTIESIQQPPTHRSAVSSASESSRLSSETGLSCFDASSTLSSASNASNASNDTKQSNDEIAIKTYAGLSATTQERIKRFEQETKAMLQRDQSRQRREAEKREEDRRRLEMQWQLAKREMENSDLLDDMVDTTVTNRLSKFFFDTGPRSAARIPSLSIAVQQQPTPVRRVSQLAEESALSMPTESASSTAMKKMKTGAEQVPSEPSSLPPIRCGSLDSLQETQDASQSSLSPTSQQRKPLSSDVSDDGSDLLTSLTTTFDRKWKSLVNSSSNQTGGRGSLTENASLGDEGVAAGTRGSQACQSLENSQNSRGGLRDEERRTTAGRSTGSSCTVETYRDPSLHKTSIEKHRYVHRKNDVPEKDTDSSVTENVGPDCQIEDTAVPDNDRSAFGRRTSESRRGEQSRSSKEIVDDRTNDANGANGANGAQGCCQIEREEEAGKELTPIGKTADEPKAARCDLDPSYSNKLEKFESLTNLEARSRLRRSESLNKRSENTASKLKRSESLNKHSAERLSSSPTNGKLKRSESLNKHSDRSDSPNSKLKRSESLTKTEKTESNISKRRQSVRKDSATKLKRKNGMPERSIKRRHTVGGTKDFDKVHWLDNKLQVETEKVVRNEYRPKKSQLRTSSPDLSAGRIGLTDASFLIEVSFRGPSNVVFNVTNARPQSLPDTSLSSKVFKVPLESHV